MDKPKVKICRKCKIPMKYQWSDVDDMGGVEEWLECPRCGRTAAVPKEVSHG